MQVRLGDLTGLNSPEFGSSGRGGKRKRPSEDGIHAEKERTAFSLDKMGLPGPRQTTASRATSTAQVSETHAAAGLLVNKVLLLGVLFECCVFHAAGTFHTDGIAASKQLLSYRGVRQVSAVKADKADRTARSRDPAGHWKAWKEKIPPGALLVLLACSAVRIGTVHGLPVNRAMLRFLRWLCLANS